MNVQKMITRNPEDEVEKSAKGANGKAGERGKTLNRTAYAKIWRYYHVKDFFRAIR